MSMSTRSIALIIGMCAGAALAQQHGFWDPEIFPFGPTAKDAIEPVHLIHVVVGGQGKVLAYGRGSSCETPSAVLWTPPPIGSPPGSSGTFESVPLDRTDLFCAGHAALADGRIFHAGGEVAFSGTIQGVKQDCGMNGS